MTISFHRITDDVIQTVSDLLSYAIQCNVSDIHIEPGAANYRVRIREDGLLREITTLSIPLALSLLVRIKIMTQLNIAEQRLPQDGHFQFDRNVNIRVNTCPMHDGEKMVLRLLNINPKLLDIDALGFLTDQKKIFLEYLQRPQGLIIVAGPTGSGKTMTLYAALKYLNQAQRNIISLEDPIEIHLSGINQIALNEKIGFDFVAALRALLRQDPDVLMIGEIRDQKTAEVAMQAAATGHLVLTTIHANGIESCYQRLQNFGVTIIETALMINQRLIRLSQGSRTGIFELAVAKDAARTSLWQAGIEKVIAGLTTHSELSNVVTPPL